MHITWLVGLRWRGQVAHSCWAGAQVSAHPRRAEDTSLHRWVCAQTDTHTQQAHQCRHAQASNTLDVRRARFESLLEGGFKSQIWELCYQLKIFVIRQLCPITLGSYLICSNTSEYTLYVLEYSIFLRGACRESISCIQFTMLIFPPHISFVSDRLATGIAVADIDFDLIESVRSRLPIAQVSSTTFYLHRI